MIHTNKTPAEIYGVKNFDLRKKAQLIQLAESTVVELQRTAMNELGRFSAGINAIHFDEKTGAIVSEQDALAHYGTKYEDDNYFTRFLKANRAFLDGGE